MPDILVRLVLIAYAGGEGFGGGRAVGRVFVVLFLVDRPCPPWPGCSLTAYACLSVCPWVSCTGGREIFLAGVAGGGLHFVAFVLSFLWA